MKGQKSGWASLCFLASRGLTDKGTGVSARRKAGERMSSTLGMDLWMRQMKSATTKRFDNGAKAVSSQKKKKKKTVAADSQQR